jgi:group I intron endonuclease
MSPCGVYLITNTISGKVYVGSSTDTKKRWRVHKCQLRKGTHDNPHLQSAWNKYGETAFVFQLLEECGREYLVEREGFWIAHYDAMDPSHGYNLNDATGGATGDSNPMRTPTTAAKVSRALLGKAKTRDHSRNIADGKSATWTFISPLGEIVSIQNLKRFCRDNTLSQGCMWLVHKGSRRSHKGWRSVNPDESVRNRGP